MQGFIIFFSKFHPTSSLCSFAKSKSGALTQKVVQHTASAIFVDLRISKDSLKFCWKIKQCLSNTLEISRCVNRSLKNRVLIGVGGGMCPQEFLSCYVLVFHQKSTKHGLKWKLASLSTSRAFEHLPKLHSFVIRWRRSSLLWPRKFSNFRCYNFWKFVIFVLHGQYVYQMKAGNILHSNLT